MSPRTNAFEAAGEVKQCIRLLPPYRPFWSFFALCITVSGLSGALIKAFPRTTGDFGAFLVNLNGAASDGEPNFFGRIPANAYIEMMVSLLALVLIYSFLQLYAVDRDFRWFAGKAGFVKDNEPSGVFNTLFAVLTGRPRGFYTADVPGPFGTYRERLADHLKFGMPSLAMPMRLFLWSFPMLGFLGTAIGLSNAIRALPGAMGRGGGAALEPVLRQLSFKFDTTIIGIVSALIVMLMIQLYERSWQNLEILAHGGNEVSGAEETLL